MRTTGFGNLLLMLILGAAAATAAATDAISATLFGFFWLPYHCADVSKNVNANVGLMGKG
jgi:hypothetical protein